MARGGGSGTVEDGRGAAAPSRMARGRRLRRGWQGGGGSVEDGERAAAR
jgi:hypothetical protein